MPTTIRRVVPALAATVLLVASAFFSTPAGAYAPPSISDNPSSGFPGSSTTVTGSNFTPGQDVTLTFHSAPSALGTVTVNGQGKFSTPVTIPSNATVGAHMIQADDPKGETASTGYTVKSKTGQGGVTVSNPNPPEGGSITVSGQGCVPNATITVSLDGGSTLATTTADSSGAYSVVVQLPSGVTGQHNITVNGAGCSGVEPINIQSGSLAGTGVAVIGIGALGVVLLAGGGLMLLAGRRRRVTPVA